MNGTARQSRKPPASRRRSRRPRPMIEISHVTHAFGRRRGGRGSGLTVLEDVTLAIPDGRFVAFLGPSGCGKTSLLRMLDGLLMPSSGTITVDGKRVTGPSADR